MTYGIGKMPPNDLQVVRGLRQLPGASTTLNDSATVGM